MTDMTDDKLLDLRLRSRSEDVATEVLRRMGARAKTALIEKRAQRVRRGA